MTRLLEFLPLVYWAVFAFAALYSVLETRFRPLGVIVASALAAAQILIGHWRIAAALIAVFAAEPIAHVVSLYGLKLRGQPLVLSALVFQAIAAALIAWIATFIHGYALKPPERTPAAARRYRIVSITTCVVVFLIMVGLSVGLSFAIHRIGVPARFRPMFFAQVIETLAYVPLALIRPALSLGLRNPVAAAFRAAVRSPVTMGVWVTALGLPGLAFRVVGAGILHAHPSLWSALVFGAATAVFNVAAGTLFETTTLLLLARKEKRYFFPNEKRR